MDSFGSGSPKEHACKIISKSIQWLKKKSFKGFSIFSFGDHVVKRSEMVCAILVAVIPAIFLYNHFKIHPLVKAEKLFKGFFSIYSPGGLFFSMQRMFRQFWQRVAQEIFLYNYFKIHPLVKEEKSFKGFYIFSFGGHFVQQGRPV